MCNAAGFPITISITNADLSMFDYIWTDDTGTIVTTGDTFEQTEVGEFTITIVLLANSDCTREEDDPVGVTEFISIPIPDVMGFCDQDLWVATFNVPEYANTTIVPIVSDPDGTLEVVDATTGEFRVSFSTDDQMSIGVALPPVTGTCPSTPFTIVADMVCIPDPTCPLPSMLSVQPVLPPLTSFLCDSTDLPFGLFVDNADTVLIEYVWTNSAGDVVEIGDTIFVTELDVLTVRGELRTDPACFAESPPITATAQFGNVQEPTIISEGCDGDTYRANILVPEYANEGLIPTVSAGTIELVDATTGEFEVAFMTDSQLSINVGLPSVTGLCDIIQFTIDSGAGCNPDPVCPLPPMLSIQPVLSPITDFLCDSSDLPFGLFVDNADTTLIEYVWTNTAGDVLEIGDTIFITQLDTLFVRGELRTDPACFAESLPITITGQFGMVEEPVVTGACDQDIYLSLIHI